jgi:hypothetical protein
MFAFALLAAQHHLMFMPNAARQSSVRCRELSSYFGIYESVCPLDRIKELPQAPEREQSDFDRKDATECRTAQEPEELIKSMMAWTIEFCSVREFDLVLKRYCTASHNHSGSSSIFVTEAMTYGRAHA